MANRLGAVDRHHIDEILRVHINELNLRRSPFPERLVRLQLIAPVLLRAQVGIAGIAVVVVQEGAREEVVAVELLDLPLDLQRQVEARRGRPETGRESGRDRGCPYVWS